ncbi:hypothetical protein [Elioraea thermophila]|uniref:hypothetical protein n=1 Tax=Elioraea thermophila TaxID=2185104 RepID=UPI000DF1B80A|nr:hypothetical protein [Elioraea thermophila]
MPALLSRAQRHGETVCCAGIDPNGNWIRLYPVSFRSLDEGKKFARWDRIRFRWLLPQDDRRPESRRVDQNSVRVLGRLVESERQRFPADRIVTGLGVEREAGRSLALLRARIIDFTDEPKSKDDLEKEAARFAALRRQADLFKTKPMIPYRPCPFRFEYRYECDDGLREGTCQDWELEATFFR